MLRITVTCIFALVMLLSVFGCQQDSWEASDINLLLDSLEHKFEWVEYRTNQEYWQLYTQGESDSLSFYEQLYNDIVTDNDIFNSLERGKLQLSDEVDLRRWELIHANFVSGRIESDRAIATLRDSLSAININYRATFDGEPRTSGDLYSMYRTHPDRQVRQRAFRAYNAVGNEIADGLAQLFRLRNQVARRAGYNNYMGLVFKEQGLDLDEYRALLKRLDSLSIAPYRRVLEGARDRIRPHDLEIWDLAYTYHVVTSRVDRHFPVDSQMLIIKRGLKDLGFVLDKLPIYFDLDSRDGKSQFAYAFPIQPPDDMRVLANLTDGIASTRVLLHEIGHTLHSAFIAQDRPIFRRNLDGCWSEGMAQTIAAFLDDPQWLEKYANMSPSLIDRYIKAKKEHDIIYLRSTLNRLYFELEAYSNPNRDLNKLYWNLFEQFMELPQHEEIKPWAATIHYTTHPVYLQNYLYADIIAAQTIQYLSANYDSFIGNPMTKAFIVQNYFRFGSRYDWRELLQRGTEEQLNPDRLIERLGI